MQTRKAKKYKWQSNEVFVSLNGVVTSGDSIVPLKDWTTKIEGCIFSLSEVYYDAFPEFCKIYNGKICLKLSELQEQYPGTILSFSFSDKDIFIIRNSTSITPKELLRIKEEIKDEILTEIRKEIFQKSTITQYHGIIQKRKDGEIIAGYINATEAYKVTGISSSSISQCLNKKISSAGGFIWELNIKK